MEQDERHILQRLEAAATLLERTLSHLEVRAASATALAGEVEKISATVDAGAASREAELMEKLEAAEREIATLKGQGGQPALNPLRKTLSPAASEMLAKHGIGDGPVDVRALDAALSGLSLEQRIAVKTQLLRSGAIS
ncbi:MAG TPA: hypothetical protein VGR47_08060 [Terracidiphilus sp.]|nr:hypothetical protein [Terracidiphilus sp.]